MQSWPLERKVQVTQLRIMEWYERWNGQVYVSFSGGKDSTVLLDLVRRIYPDVEAVFVDTGLEYPEIRDFVKTKENVTWLRPRMLFPEVIKEYGYPIIGKEVADNIYYAQRGRKYAINRINGLKADGTPSEYRLSQKKWAYLVDAPFRIGGNCCRVMKKNPIKIFCRASKKKGIIGSLACESGLRRNEWLKNGCNSFDVEYPTSKPLSFWKENDILEYLQRTEIPYCPIYGKIEGKPGKLKTTGLQRTGCMFCMFGLHLDKLPNRIQTMAYTHPKQYEYCMRPVEENGLGLARVLDYINVAHDPQPPKVKRPRGRPRKVKPDDTK